MKVFKVVYEEDGETTKGDGVRSTEIRQCQLLYAAETIQQVWVAIKYLLDDEERQVTSVAEAAPAITILKAEE